MAKKLSDFNTTQAIADAWAFLWKLKLKDRADMKPGSYSYGDTFYITATEVERQVRQFAAEHARGEKRGSSGIGYPGAGYGLRFSGDLLGTVRKWLLRNPDISSHNFGRGHISGQRFRPRGQPLAPGEQATVDRKARDRVSPPVRPVHLSNAQRAPLCVKRQPSPWRRQPSKALRTTDPMKVTCQRCLNANALKAEAVS